MTSIKTTCSKCGDIELTPDDVKLELKPSATDGVYRFKCPACLEVRRLPANERVVKVLRAVCVGVEIVVIAPITEVEIQQFAVRLNLEPNPLRFI